MTLVATFVDHTEGMTFIPTSAPAPYGGKVMVGHEFTGSVEFIDPNCSAPCNTSTTVAIGIPVEDLWFLQPNQDFYGVDHNESGSSAPPAGVGGTIWRAPAAQFVPYIGQVLLAREHKDATNDNLYALNLSTLAVTSLTGWRGSGRPMGAHHVRASTAATTAAERVRRRDQSALQDGDTGWVGRATAWRQPWRDPEGSFPGWRIRHRRHRRWLGLRAGSRRN